MALLCSEEIAVCVQWAPRLCLRFTWNYTHNCLLLLCLENTFIFDLCYLIFMKKYRGFIFCFMQPELQLEFLRAKLSFWWISLEPISICVRKHPLWSKSLHYPLFKQWLRLAYLYALIRNTLVFNALFNSNFLLQNVNIVWSVLGWRSLPASLTVSLHISWPLCAQWYTHSAICGIYVKPLQYCIFSEM